MPPGMKNQRGFTLVELLVGMVLLIIILAVGYGFYFFGNRSFTEGQIQSDLQQNVRLLADLINREVRYAEVMEIIPPVVNPAHLSTDWDYIFLYNQEIKHKRMGQPPADLFTPISQGKEFELTFSSRDNTLSSTVDGTFEGRAYSVETEVVLSNLSAIQGLSIGQAVRFRTPAPLEPMFNFVFLAPEEHIEGKKTLQPIQVSIKTEFIAATAWARSEFQLAEKVNEPGWISNWVPQWDGFYIVNDHYIDNSNETTFFLQWNAAQGIPSGQSLEDLPPGIYWIRSQIWTDSSKTELLIDYPFTRPYLIMPLINKAEIITTQIIRLTFMKEMDNSAGQLTDPGHWTIYTDGAPAALNVGSITYEPENLELTFTLENSSLNPNKTYYIKPHPGEITVLDGAYKSGKVYGRLLE